jgi:hypothetical protein
MELTDSDDVSALTMAGASVIAYRAQISQLNQQVEIDATIQEDDAEHDVGQEVGDKQRRSSMETNSSENVNKASPHRRQSIVTMPLNPNVNAEEIIFADDHQLLERHKSKKKKKHKSKKHHKRDRHKDFIEIVEYEMSHPINEICFPKVDPSTAGGSHESISHTRPLTTTVKGDPSVASTAESTGSRYLRRDSLQTSNSGSGVAYSSFVVNTFRSQSTDLPDIPQSNSNRSSFASHHSSNLPSSNPSSFLSNPNHENLNSPSSYLRSSFRSNFSNESLAHKSFLSGHGSVAQISHHSGHDSLAHKSHLSGYDSIAHKSHLSTHSNASYSHVTAADIEQIRNNLEAAQVEEAKVMELHSKLESEILKLIERAETMEEHRVEVASELKSASKERERLQTKLNMMLDDNTRMNARLQKMEEQEDEKRLDDVLDGMQAKMRALRLKSIKKGRISR